MSLQLAAQHLAAQGRGNDSTLVHMTPSEVQGLQQIAKAAGGSLSVNPSTGLPEAGFLEDMLPMIIGGGLAVATGGTSLALTPGMIGLGIGGIQALRTGNLMDGVKAGLGAYGGAGLAGGLIGAGAASAANTAGAMADVGAGAPSFASNMSNMGQGIAGLGTEAGRAGFMSSMGGVSGLAKSGLAAAAPMLMPETATPTPITPDKDMGQRYSYSKGPTTPFPMPNVPRAGSPEQFQSFGKEQQYFTPRYTKIGAEDARALYGYAGGGPVEAMSNANALGANTGYPMADINKGAYATPWQTPISRNVVNGASDTNVDQVTGEMKFADGGETTIKYDPGKQQYEIIKESQSRSPTTQELVNAAGGGGGADGGAGTAGSSGSGSSMGLGHGIGAISAGQGLSAYGSMLGGMAPGGLLAGLIGAGLLASGINDLSEAEAGAHSMGGDFSGHAGLDAGSFGYGGPGADASASSGLDAGSFGYGGPGADAGASSSGGDSGGADGGGEAGGGLMHAYAAGGGYNLGDYSDGGRLLRGPGDGVSDSIPATIGKKQPARLADGEFVVPARIVSELGNGSTEAGARKLYAMMDRVQSARGKTVGKGKVAKNSRAERYLPA